MIVRALMLWGYFDDSKGEDVSPGKSVALGGSLAELEGWCRLVPKWEKVIHDSGMGWFHATEWKSRESELRGYWERLIEIMNVHLIAHVGCVVPAYMVKALETGKVEAQHRVDQSEETAGLEFEWIAREHAPIGLCLAWCLAKSVEVTVQAFEDKVALLFAKTDKLQGSEAWLDKIIKFMPEGARHLGPTKHDLSPGNLVQLQAADLVAFEVTSYRHPGPVRWQYQALRPKLRVHVAETPRLPDLWQL